MVNDTTYANLQNISKDNGFVRLQSLVNALVNLNAIAKLTKLKGQRTV